MPRSHFDDIFTQDALCKLFPAERSDRFFEALFGDTEEGAYDISLDFKGYVREDNRLDFELRLKERAGKCLGCSLTYGLPQVFSRHPVINIKGVVREIEQLLDGNTTCKEWFLGNTHIASQTLHVIPLSLLLNE